MHGFMPEFDQNVSVVEQIQVLKKVNVKHLIVTLGSRGCLYLDQDDHFLVPAISVHPVDTTGAGDCFIGSFSAFFNGKNFKYAIAAGCAAAGLSTERRGTSKSCP